MNLPTRPAAPASTLPEATPAEVRAALLARREIALLDAREEHPHAQAHPLFAAQLPLGRLERDAVWRLPRRDVPIVVFDDGEGLASVAARRLQGLGYTDVRLLAGGLAGWRAAGYELFRDVNVPSKAFGELVEHVRHTPSLPAEAVHRLVTSGANVVVLDARRFDEYRTMSIPGGISVPGAELALRVRDLAPDPRTQVIVNCAGRTRSIIGTQSLVNAGIPNPVAALRNGTIGWTLAGFALEHAADRRFGAASPASLEQARRAAQALADRAGARRLDATGLQRWLADTSRTLYRWDVRTPEEYAQGHLPGFGSAPGGQLVQETDVYAAVRGARIVLVDGGARDDGVRAPMTAHWLAQMGWEVAWLADADPAAFGERGPWRPAPPPMPVVRRLAPGRVAELAAAGEPVQVLDLGSAAAYVAAHVPGAAWVLRQDLGAVAARLGQRSDQTVFVVTCPDGVHAALAAGELGLQTCHPVFVLDGGTAAWVAAGLPVARGDERMESPRIDRYRRPYEGTDAPREAMQAYLDWEFGLVAQLGRDGTHDFRVLPAA